MNILICSIDYKPQDGGIAELTYNLGKGFQEKGYSVYVLAPHMDGDSDFDNQESRISTYRSVNVLPIGWFSYKRMITQFPQFARTLYQLPRVYADMKRIILERNINKIICTYWDLYGVLSIFIRWRMRIPYYIFVHGLDIIRRPTSFMNFLKYSFTWCIQNISFLNSAGILADSDFTKDVVYKNRLGRTVPVHVVYCGVDVTAFYPEAPDIRYQKQYNLIGKKVLLTISRLVKRKGIDITLQALHEYYMKYPDSSLVYLICGKGPDEERLRRIVSELRLSDKVRFAGFIPDSQKRAIYNLSDIFIMPSREEQNGDVEGFGLVFLEANACGKPVIAGHSGGIPSAVKDGVNGVLVDPLTPGDIMQKIEFLLSNYSYATDMGFRGRSLVEQNYTWDRVCERFFIATNIG